jgi:muramoyltetrapeptide carboxypeptidase
MQIRPPILKRGDLVGIAAPARWVRPEDISVFVNILEEEGYEIRIGKVHRRFNQFAGNDSERLADLQSMFNDPGVRAIFCARGGYGSMRLLGEIDLEEFSKYPKWLVGFSDITALHSLLQDRLGCESIHAGMPYTFKNHSYREDKSITSLLDVIRGLMPEYRVKPHQLNRHGETEGILKGGNLSVLYSLTGTPYQPDTRDAILFLEDIDEYLYHIDRMMINLKLSGMLSDLRGLIIGGMTDMHDNEISFGKDTCQIIREAVDEYDYPLLFDFPAGHTNSNTALILGRNHRIIVDDRGGYLTEFESRQK